jgi:ParB family transcriptional regulator, chromosome partitioning protein
MAMIATLRPTEGAHPGNAYSIASIPLNKLVPWDGNVRKTGASDDLGELKASIAALGVLQSLVVKKTNRGKYAIIAGRRRFLCLSALSNEGTIEADAPVPCRIIPGSADATEISLTENVVRTAMHPADQFEAFRNLIDSGSSVADVAARFGVGETVVKKRLKLARVSPLVFEGYREGKLTLEQVQAFAASDDHDMQERVFGELSHRSDDPEAIRSALTEHEIAASNRHARFVTLAAYEEAGGALRRDLFAEGDDGIFLLDSALLYRLATEKLQVEAELVKAEGWKWVEAIPELDHEARGEFRMRRPEPMPLSEAATEERRQLADEYNRLFDTMEEGDEETSARLDEIEARMNTLEETQSVYTPETLAIAGAIVSVGRNGELEIYRGLVRSEDELEELRDEPKKEKPEFSAALVESLTDARSAAISALLAVNPHVALAAVTHELASGLFRPGPHAGSLQLSARLTHHREESRGASDLECIREEWLGKLPSDNGALWDWCLAQDTDTLLQLLAYCAARSVNAVQAKHERSDSPRIKHANALASALNLDMTRCFTPTADNYFGRVGRTDILCAITEAKGAPAKRSWDKLKKSELAILAEREIAGTGWLPKPLRALM